MDGGRILRALLAERMDYIRATRRAVTIGQAFAMLFIFLGVWNTWLMLIGFFLFVGAQLEDRSVVFQSVLESVRMEDVMLTGFSTLSPADTLEDALQKPCTPCKTTFRWCAAAIWWASSASNASWIAAPRRQWLCAVGHGAGLRDCAAHRLAGVCLSQARRRGLNMIPVVDHQRLVGIVTMQNLMHSMALLAETRRLQEQQESG